MVMLTYRSSVSLCLLVGSARGNEYLPENLDPRFSNWSATPAIGSIPEVNTTFAYIDGAYGIINEHQVAIGESTCGARFASKPVSHGGAALFDVAELSRIALQRATTAREAIQLMGDLGVQYGYYGVEWDTADALAEAGEALTVTDPIEAWMFHILPDDTGASAIWAAQRVPDDHIAAVANQFVIHDVDLSRPDDFMASPNLHTVAERHGLWNKSDTTNRFDFTRVYAQPRAEGHQHYSTRRVWRVFTLADPALTLSPSTDVFASDYPFSVAPARALSPHDLMRFQRDHYEGTRFDMTTGPASGPFGDPDRYDAGVRDSDDLTPADVAAGAFERAISIFRASYSFVSVLDPANADNAYIWFGQYAPHATVYAPVYAKVAAVPTPYTTGSLFAFDRASSFWVHALVGNWAARLYAYAHPVVARVQQELEALVGSMQTDLLAQAAVVRKSEGEAALAAFLTAQSALFASQSHETFTALFEYLVTRLHDGYEVSGLDTDRLTVKPLFYPKWWLQQVGYFGNATNTTDADSTGSKAGSSGAHVVASGPSVVPTVAPAPLPTKTVTPAPAPTETPTPSPTTETPVTTVPIAPLPSPLPTTEKPMPLPSPSSVAETPTPVAVVSVGNAPSNASLAASHTLSYWTAALFSLLSCAVGVFIGRNVRGQSSGYRPIR